MIKRVKQFEIQRTNDGFIVYNTNLKWKGHHTHVKGYSFCLKMVFDILKNKRPDTHNLRQLESYRRLSECTKYKEVIEELKVARGDKKPNYININKGVKR